MITKNSTTENTTAPELKPAQQGEGIANKYGAYYYTGYGIHHSDPQDLYTYTAYLGNHSITVEKGDSVVGVRNGSAYWFSDPSGLELESGEFACVIRGYQCGKKNVSLDQRANLPYVNGCATRQLFAPERIGDPTLQQLTIPPFTSEQVHHIHPTARVVYVLEGEGYSIVGQSDKAEETKLVKGMLCVLDPMTPHHFRTEDSYLTVIPFHTFSSTPPALEQNHPMFNGTRPV